MTQDYKDLTLKYITDNIQEEPNNTNQFRDNQIITNNLTAILTEAIGKTPSTYKILTTTTTSNYLVYGEYSAEAGDPNIAYGYIAVLNENGIIQHVYTTYDSGTKLSYAMELTYDENGNIYGIDETNQKKRIIFLNNVALNSATGYHCRLRTSYYVNYNIKTNYSSYKGICPIKKVPGEPIYYIFAQTTDQNSKVMLIKFVNNVGMPNEWYSYEGETIGAFWINGYDSIIEKSGDSEIIDIYYAVQTATAFNLKHVYFDGDTLSIVTSYELPTGRPVLDLRMATKNKVYVTSRKNNNDNTYNMYLYLLDNNYLFTIDDTQLTITTPGYYLSYQNGIIFGKISGYVSGTFKVMCIVYDGTFTKSPVYELDINDYLTTGCEVLNTFSLYKFIIQGGSVCCHPSIVIYNGYSGASKEDYNSVSSARGELYSNGYIMFARPLYNKQVVSNRTISTLEIPNSYLNNITIDKKDLLSYSDNLLVSDTNEISKNVYEQLFINFNNTLSVIDEDTSTFYPNTASYINENINIGTKDNCNSTSVLKARINYSDSSLIQNLTWNYVTDHYETTFAVDATTKDIVSIDFLSNDENTIYLTKNLSLSNGYYSVSQKLRIE